MSNRWNIKIGLVVIVSVLIFLFFKYDFSRYLTLHELKEAQGQIQALIQSHPLELTLGYFLLYVVLTALSLPGATILTLAGGAIFGLVKGTIIVSFASTIGATLAFLGARFILRDGIEVRFRTQFEKINQGILKEGSFYLFTLRLIPAFPFFVINLLMGLTKMKTSTYFIISQIGMLPATILYVNAGTELSKITSLSEILTPNILISFALLGIVPLLLKLRRGA